MSQPDTAHRPHRHAPGGEPGHDQQRRDQRKAEDHSRSGVLTGSSRSKYTRSMRRRRTRSTTTRTPDRLSESPERGTRPNSAYTKPPTVVTSSTPKSTLIRSDSSSRVTDPETQYRVVPSCSIGGSSLSYSSRISPTI